MLRLFGFVCRTVSYAGIRSSFESLRTSGLV